MSKNAWWLQVFFLLENAKKHLTGTKRFQD
jgi:hypothetical protein